MGARGTVVKRLEHGIEVELVEVAREMADAARRETLAFFRAPGLRTENKDDGGGWDPVTEADRNAERAMRCVLERRRPDDGILGEEFGATDGCTGLQWVLDPIDGTRSFISGVPLWGVLIAVSDESGPLFGIVDQPHIGERFEGGFGTASVVDRHGRRELRTRRTGRIGDAILFTTFPEIGTPGERSAFERLSDRAMLTRYGTDCYAYTLLAGGHIDLVVEAGLHPYDIHAPIALVLAAGGVVTDWSGAPAHESSRIVAAATPELHRIAVEVMAFQE